MICKLRLPLHLQPLRQLQHKQYTRTRMLELWTIETRFLLNEEAGRLDRLQPTVKHGCERHAVISVVPEASSRQSSVCHRIRKFDLDICRGLHGLGAYGFPSAPARSWDRGARCFVRGFMLGLDEAAACFEGSMTGESACRSMVPAKCYAVHSG